MATLPMSSDLEIRLEEDRQRIGYTIEEIRSVLQRDMNVRRQLARHITPALAVCAIIGVIIGRVIRNVI